MKNLIALFILIICSGSVYSQKGKFEDALIIAEKGDTIVGKILKKSDKSMSFQVDVVLNDEMKNFKPNDIEGFCIKRNKDIYRSVPYLKDKSSETIVKRFGKLLVEGDVSLYKLNIPFEETDYSFETPKERVYIIQKDTSYYTLSQYEKLSKREEDFTIGRLQGLTLNPTYATIKKEYLGVLSYVLRDCPNIPNEISKVGFYDKDMISVIEKYNRYCLVKD